MTLSMFNECLDNLNENFKNKNKRVLLILDNAPVHPIDTNYPNIELFYLSPNTTSLTQVLD